MLKPTIGLEIHVALATKKKLFSTTDNIFQVEDFSLFDIGTPGYLPVLNYEPIEMAGAFALSIGAELRKVSIFERKHYFYPDLPIGYQITQQHNPIMVGGRVDDVIIEHAHLECDAAKSMHTGGKTFINISRCASPLLEIVTTPCIKSPQQAKEFAKQVHNLVTFLGICDGKLEEGSFRVDASISVSDTDKLGTRVEIKNISSFTFLENALEFEIERQRELIANNGLVKMETRMFDEDSLETLPMREKETVANYRYTPDPDIPHLVLPDDIETIIQQKYNCDYFPVMEKLSSINIDTATKTYTFKKYPELIRIFANSSLNERYTKFFFHWIKDIEIHRPLTWDTVSFLCDSTLSAAEIKSVLQIWGNSDKTISACMPTVDNNSNILISDILNKYPSELSQLKTSPKIIQFLIGKCMAELKGKVSANIVKTFIETHYM